MNILWILSVLTVVLLVVDGQLLPESDYQNAVIIDYNDLSLQNLDLGKTVFHYDLDEHIKCHKKCVSSGKNTGLLILPETCVCFQTKNEFTSFFFDALKRERLTHDPIYDPYNSISDESN